MNKFFFKNNLRVHSILWAIFSVFLIGCSSSMEHSNRNDAVSAIKPVNGASYQSYFQNPANHQGYIPNAAIALTLNNQPNELIHARQIAYQNVLANRLARYGIKEYYLNKNGVVFVTELASVDTLRFRDFVRSGFCPLVKDLAQGFGNNRRVMMLNSTARQGRYIDYSFDLCKKIGGLSVKEANRMLFPKILNF